MSLTAETIVERTAPSHPAPVGLWALWFGVIAAPLFWFGQLLWNYGATALACYPAEAPRQYPIYAWSRATTLAFDALAILAALAGCYVAWSSLAKARAKAGNGHPLNVFGERARFMAQWGLIFSAGFFLAIVFETIANVTVPLCGIP